MITLKQRKKRILVVNEFSQLSTGFSTYMRYLLPRLHATGKYEIAEHAVYIDPHHPEIDNVPWKVFPNLPDQRDRKGQDLYKQNRFNQFGAWKFEEVCLKWQPDIVIDIRDPWMSSFIFKSPYRKYFKFIHMPTCDGEPQKPEWLDTYAGADRILTYSHWAKQVLESSSGGKIQVFDVGSPCPDIEEFRPVNKAETRNKLGLKPDSFIIQTVMRNQPRKLYPELFRAFARFLELCKERNRDDIASKSFLHCHTSHPDLGWDLPVELRRYGISHKVLFTYLCDHCKSCYVTFFNQEVSPCRACGNTTAGLPNTVRGVDRPDLAKIMGMADLYIQYSVCLAKGEKVLTQEGWKPIEIVSTRDRVWTHKGRWMPVTDTMEHSIGNRQMLKVEVYGDYETLSCTAEHPIHAITHQVLDSEAKQTTRELVGTLLRFDKDLPESQFVEAGSLVKGDLIESIIDDEVVDHDKIDLALHIDNVIIDGSTIKLSTGDTYPRFVTINDDFCRFVGLFAADGTVSNRGQIRVCCHNREETNIALASTITTKLLNKASQTHEYDGRSAVDIIGCSEIHNILFSSWFRKHEEKKLPSWVMKLPVSKQKQVLQGLFMGDGHFDKRNVSVYATISPILAQQIKTLLQRCRVYYNVHIDDKTSCKDGKNRQIQYRFEVPGNIKAGEFVTKRSSSDSLYHNNKFYRKVKSLTPIEYAGNVYNIEVKEDNSYTTLIGNAHNCEGFGMPVMDAKSCGVPIMGIEYSATAELANSPGGIPVKVGRLHQESLAGTNQWRSLPDIEDTAEKMFAFFTASPEYRETLGRDARKLCETHYNWDLMTKVWENAIDTLEVPDPKDTWFSNPKLIRPNTQIPPNLSHEQFVEWCFRNILNEPLTANPEFAQKAIASLHVGYEPGQDPEGHPIKVPVNRDTVLNHMMHTINHKNQMEMIRYNMLVAAQHQKPEPGAVNYVEV